MRILIASDSFKDALPAAEVCRSIAEGLRQNQGNADIALFPLADGGEGTFEVLAFHLDLHAVEVDTFDPLLRPIRASYGLSADGSTAVVELARASGLQLLSQQERNPLHTSTYGTGLLLADAIDKGVSKIILALGGSATNDAGAGMASALGWNFLDDSGHEMAVTGLALSQIARITPPEFVIVPETEVICDVTNPLFGPEGAAFVYARQKGADELGISILDAGLRHVARLTTEQLGKSDLARIPGAGAAGGTGFGAMAFLNATLRRGADLVMDIAGFDDALAKTDLVITGEGQLDGQTLHGKLVQSICRRATLSGVPVVALCGRLAASPEQLAAIGLKAAWSINEVERPLQEMLNRTAENLTRTAAQIPLSWNL